ncbi:MAG: hypothetical protein L6R39_006416 [Caloplaca ligustica]|nr:MAG: hypothetical protein L6R39_006416 [Caloplaca ligustica]
MADPPPSSAAISAAFPVPPPFYKAFTPANLARLTELQQSNPSFTSDDLPPDLRHLLPPPPPSANQEYRTFGETHQAPAPAATDAAPKEPPDPHRLIQTTRQLLLTFLSLTHALATDPDTWAPKWDEMKALFSEAHAIVNEYRPHQARETLINLMEEQMERCKAETKACREACEQVRGVLEKVEDGDGLVQPDSGVEKGDRGELGKSQDLKMVTEKKIWDVIQQEVGIFD